ncbi:putative UDP-rhamnose:rhamnosyltransferase 1 [Hordeum vulgare subsp. vulgare]|uniref:Glycosyltransferase n=1 Tax=Hordeum vulgare subsp. vulgare TaxID=112509 RepID=A0A8I6XM14_HORVV|nr:putative UDP-rhamnose:rhamnosyltransferase 1 [Hordeum vulgare subsp. vulgare]
MEATADAADVLEVVIFPWLAFGHMLSFLELSKRLAARGHAVAFVSTPRNIARLPPVPPRLSPRLRFVALPLPRVDGLPDGAESTADVPPEKIDLVKKAMDGLEAPLTAFLADAVAAGRRPDWIVHDFCHHWVPPIATGHGVPCAVFTTVYAAFQAFLGPRSANVEHPRAATEDFAVAPRWIPFPSTIAYRRRSEAEWIAGSFRANASGVSDMDRVWQLLELCRLAIYRSCDEIEPGMFALLTDLFQQPAIPAGILLPPVIADDDGDRAEALRWLDDQPPKSVIYVALGSEAPLTPGVLHELALGLELAGVRFLWALRRPSGMFSAANDAVTGELLPAGFEERTRGRGLVRTGWMPQMAALAHGATGAFLTHCGWGSTIESFASGHPLVMLPFVLDQPLVARAMAERGVGVEVARDEGDGSFDRDGVAAAVRRVMVDEEGKALASNAMKLREVLTDHGRQETYIDDLVERLRRYRGCC